MERQSGGIAKLTIALAPAARLSWSLATIYGPNLAMLPSDLVDTPEPILCSMLVKIPSARLQDS